MVGHRRQTVNEGIEFEPNDRLQDSWGWTRSPPYTVELQASRRL